MMGLRLRWLVIFSAALVLMGGKPVASPNNAQAVKPNKMVIRQNRYEVYGGFLNFYDLTTLTVRNGRVVARAYKYFETNDKGEYEVMDEYSWTEKGAMVGSHKEYGAAPRTIDELYRECRDTVLTRNPRAHDIYLRTCIKT